jgi:hypothetical protein
MAPPKRAHGTIIDLTGDDNLEPQRKHPRLNASASTAASAARHTSSPSLSQSSSQPSWASRSSQPSPRTSLSSSQCLPSSQTINLDDDEHEVFDLTQADDGPAFELYGLIGNLPKLNLLLNSLTVAKITKLSDADITEAMLLLERPSSCIVSPPIK